MAVSMSSSMSISQLSELSINPADELNWIGIWYVTKLVVWPKTRFHKFHQIPIKGRQSFRSGPD
jgi:hypothetical protein